MDDDTVLVRALDRTTIDEVQRVPDLLRAIKKSVDDDRRAGRFLLTGSANNLGSKFEATGSERTIEGMSTGSVDDLVVWKFDRFARNLNTLISTVARIGYASRLNQATDGEGFSPPRLAALSAATRDFHPQSTSTFSRRTYNGDFSPSIEIQKRLTLAIRQSQGSGRKV